MEAFVGRLRRDPADRSLLDDPCLASITHSDAVKLWNAVVNVENTATNRDAVISAQLRETAIKGVQGSLAPPWDEGTLLRLLEMCIRTAKAYVPVEPAKCAEFIELAEQYDSHLQVEVLGRKSDSKRDSLRAQLTLLNLERGQPLTLPVSLAAQSELVDGVVELMGTHLKDGDYLKCKEVGKELLQLKPPVLSDNPKKHAHVLTLVSEACLGLELLQEARTLVNEALDRHRALPGLIVKLKTLLVSHPTSAEIVSLFAAGMPAQQAAYQLFHMVAEARSAELAFECIQAAFSEKASLSDAQRQEVVALRLAIACKDSSLAEDQKLEYTRSILEADPIATWQDSGPIQELFMHQIDRCVKNRASAAMKWLEMAQTLFAEDSRYTTALQHRSISCLLQTMQLDEAEARILDVPSDSVQGCALRIELAIKRGSIPDACALLSQLVHIPTAASSDLIAILDLSTDPSVHLCALRGAAQLEHDNEDIVKAILCLAGSASSLDLSDRIAVVRAYPLSGQPDLLHKITWNIGQDATAQCKHLDAAEMFERCFACAQTDEERFLALFFNLQSRLFSDSEWNASDRALVRRCRELFPKGKKRNIDPEQALSMLTVIEVHCLVALEAWAELRELLGANPLSGCLERAINAIVKADSVPHDIHLAALTRLIDGATSMDVSQFASLFRGITMAAILANGVNDDSLEYFRQAAQFLPQYPYPRQESLWLCVTAFNSAMNLLGWGDQAQAQRWCEQAIFLCKFVDPEDKGAYERRIREGYTRILQAAAQ